MQAGLGTLITWVMTAAGAAVVFLIPSNMGFDAERKLLDTSLGFAVGVMMAASYWSLLVPAEEVAKESGIYGESGQYAFVPMAVGFLIGCIFVMLSGFLLPEINIEDVLKENKKLQSNREQRLQKNDPEQLKKIEFEQKRSWKRIILLVIAIAVHKIPEGLAVGVGFGTKGTNSPRVSFDRAYNLAIGIGLQSFPEGLAVSLPLLRLGYSPFKCFWYGQLSGMVEPIAGLFGAFTVTIMEPLLPYALSFAAGSMLYVIVDDMIPEAREAGNGTYASIGFVVGFLTMMTMDIALG